ncbi:MAG TPA: MBL fold metallo-hydrolase [Candidatus Nanopelagicales bacterium]|nr:MBL fold metallo-hydrolase [Candidatus Nanopelagicales bacterium]
MVLAPDTLYVFVFGPVYGESVVLRIPPEHWVVIDGCSSSSFSSYPAELLKHFRAHADVVVLTHPHLDHAKGLDVVLEDWKGAKIGCCEPAVEKVDELHANLQRSLNGSKMKKVLSRIQSIWEERPSTRWPLRRGVRHEVGGGSLEILHPLNASWRKSSVNALSSPILLKWEQVCLLFGSDLEQPGWEEISALRIPLARHHLLKVPHHASANGRHDAVARRDGSWSSSRLWIATPMNRGEKVPRFEDGEGLARWLEHEPEMHLTALPEPYRPPSPPPWRAPRRSVLAGSRPPGMPHIPGLPGMVPDPPPRNSLDHFIMAAYSSDGRCVEVQHGEGTVVVEA